MLPNLMPWGSAYGCVVQLLDYVYLLFAMDKYRSTGM